MGFYLKGRKELARDRGEGTENTGRLWQRVGHLKVKCHGTGCCCSRRRPSKGRCEDWAPSSDGTGLPLTGGGVRAGLRLAGPELRRQEWAARV